MSDGPAVDPAALARLKEWGGDSLLKDLIVLFRETTPVRITEIRGGIAGGSTDETERGAHTLKSSSGNLGAMRIYELASQIEARAIAGELEELSPLVDELQREFDRARTELESVEEGLSP